MNNQNNDEFDRELLAKIASGDEAAMQDFFHRHHTSVYAFAIKRLSEAADAADVVNDVMLQVWQKAGTFEGRSKVRTWMLGIANNKVLDHFRKRGRDRHEELDDQIEDEAANTGLLDISLAQDADAILHCMEKLSDAHRRVVHLAFYEDLPYPEIAQVLECPPGTVKTRMMHAKNNLKRCLQTRMSA